MPQWRRRGKAGQSVRARESLKAIPADLIFKFEIMAHLRQRMSADVR